MNKKLKHSWVKVPLLVMTAFVVIFASQDAFAETEVTIPNEASEPSCAESGTCFSPGEVTIGVGDSVAWHNDSTAAHTVTSGNPEDGPDGLFDSSLFLAPRAGSPRATWQDEMITLAAATSAAATSRRVRIMEIWALGGTERASEANV